MRWTADRLPDLSGRTAIVTGANSGIGYHAAKELAVHGANVVLACRNTDGAATAAQRIAQGGARAPEVASLDLASMASVRSFIDGLDGPVDLLVNNAGVMAPRKLTSTADGFELQFGTNHLGHFVLTGLMLPALLASSGGARVVTVSSVAHHGGTEAVLDANAAAVYDARRTYAESKLANLLFAMQLQREFEARGLPVTSTAAHPGVSATRLFTNRQGLGANPVVRAVGPAFMAAFLQSATAGARPLLYAATDADPGSYTGPQHLGETRGPLGRAKRSSCAQDEKLARRLWQVSEELTHFHYPWPGPAV